MSEGNVMTPSKVVDRPGQTTDGPTDHDRPEKATVLVVDDRPADRHYLEAIVNSLGHRFVGASDAGAGFELAKQLQPDLVITDVLLPTIGGYDLTRQLRKDPLTRDLRIVLTTAASVDQRLVRLARAAGAQSVIPKPSEPAAVLAFISDALSSPARQGDVDLDERFDQELRGLLTQDLSRKIEELEAANRRLQHTEEQLRAVIDSADAFLSIDVAGRVTYWNAAAERLLGWRASEVAGEPFVGTVIPRESAPILRALVDDLRSAGHATGSRRAEVTGLHSDGTVLDLELMSWASGSGEDAALNFCIHDIGARKATEAAMRKARDEAAAASQMKSAFLANMSHEIRTPMNGIIGMTALLLDTAMDDRQSEYAEAIRTSGESLLMIINDILDFSKIEAGKLDLDVRDFETSAIVREVAHVLAVGAFDKGVEMVVRIAGDVPAQLRSDRSRLRQILMNLVSNAVKFTESGEIVVDVGVGRSAGGEDVVRFEVRDTGPGIPAEKLPLLFRPFTQVDSTTTRKQGGTGLGLAISRQLIELMGGTSGVESELGVGTTFWFELPAPAGAPQGGACAPDARVAGLRVLIVDDNATNGAALVKLLAGAGAEPSYLADADSAFAALTAAAAEQPFDVALVDMVMPGAGGVELARKVMAAPALSSVRLVLLGAVHRPVERRAAAAAFAADLSKPVVPDELFACLSGLGNPSERPAPIPPAVVAAAATTDGHTRQLRVLLAEDSEMNQRLATTMLTMAGMAVDVVPDGRKAVEAMALRTYDIVLMDGQMPEMDGYEATREIRRLEGSGRRTPIVAVTASAMKDDRDRVLAAGMDDYLAKPFRKQTLLDIVHRWTSDGEAVLPAP